MSNAHCNRCNDEGMAGYRHVAGGMCFACGRMPDGTVASPVLRASARERVIGRLFGLLRRAEQEKEAGTLGAWWAEVRDTDADGSPGVRQIVAAAPVDVAERARAAFAKVGLSVA